MDNAKYANMLYRLLKTNYDYFYLKSRLEGNGGKIIIVGSSYAVKGIDVTMFSLDTVNCSTSSQDLYYDREFIRAFSQKKRKPENIIVILGYYDLFRDISLEIESGLEIVKMVYYPLFHTSRNNEELVKDYDLFNNIDEIDLSGSTKTEMEKRVLGLLSKRCNLLSDYELRKSAVYYYEDKPWRLCPEQVKRDKAKKRAEDHFNCFSYKESLEDNIKIIEEICRISDNLNSRLFFIIPPFSRYYLEYLNEEMISKQTEIIRGFCSQPSLEYYDFNDIYDGSFDDNDFLDMDHLNGRGALKLSMLLDGLIMS